MSCSPEHTIVGPAACRRHRRRPATLTPAPPNSTHRAEGMVTDLPSSSTNSATAYELAQVPANRRPRAASICLRTAQRHVYRGEEHPERVRALARIGFVPSADGM
jgi:hypothetical protein